MAAQVVCRLPGNDRCPSHTGQKVSLCCINCDTLVCVRCVTSRFHRGHEFEDLREATKREIENLQEILDINENTDLVQLKQDVDNITEHREEIGIEHNNISALIKTRVREIKEEADRQAEILLGDCENNAAENYDLLLDYQTALETQRRNCEEQIDMLKITLQSGNEIEVFDTRHNIKTFIVGSSAPLKLATYQPSTSVSEVVSLALGSLVWPADQSREQMSKAEPLPLKHSPTAERWQKKSKPKPIQQRTQRRSHTTQRNESRENKFLKDFTSELGRLTDRMQKDLGSTDEESDTQEPFREQRRERQPQRQRQRPSDDDWNGELDEIVRRHLKYN